jgi:hypothetical protein
VRDCVATQWVRLPGDAPAGRSGLHDGRGCHPASGGATPSRGALHLWLRETGEPAQEFGVRAPASASADGRNSRPPFRPDAADPLRVPARQRRSRRGAVARLRVDLSPPRRRIRCIAVVHPSFVMRRLGYIAPHAAGEPRGSHSLRPRARRSA